MSPKLIDLIRKLHKLAHERPVKPGRVQQIVQLADELLDELLALVGSGA